MRDPPKPLRGDRALTSGAPYETQGTRQPRRGTLQEFRVEVDNVLGFPFGVHRCPEILGAARRRLRRPRPATATRSHSPGRRGEAYEDSAIKRFERTTSSRRVLEVQRPRHPAGAGQGRSKSRGQRVRERAMADPPDRNQQPAGRGGADADSVPRPQAARTPRGHAELRARAPEERFPDAVQVFTRGVQPAGWCPRPPVSLPAQSSTQEHAPSVTEGPQATAPTSIS